MKDLRRSMVKGAACIFVASSLLAAGSASAHFGMVIPGQPAATQEQKSTTITLSFSHPFENHTMELVSPEKFYVSAEGKVTDLKKNLEQFKLQDHTAWRTDFTFERPGVYQFVMEPTPYWEPAEDVSIIHYTKTIVPAYGEDQGWGEPVGLPTEIVPLLRPFGNYAGNSFIGQVLIDGKPAANAEVEVELYNPENKYSAPSDYHITQVVMADANGVFSFTCPTAGWYGFAALSEADYTIKDPDGNDKGVELGAVLWTYFHPMTMAQ